MSAAITTSRKIRLKTPIPKTSEQLQISKESRQIEDKLNTKLIAQVKQLQKLQMEQQGLLLLYSLDYKERISSNIRSAVEQIYQSAGSYVSAFTGREYYTTRTDLDTIERLSLTYNDLFFQRLSRFVFSSNQGKQINAENVVNMTTATLTQDTLRTAIVTKAQQIITMTPISITTAAIADDMPNDTSNIVYVWVTSQDDRVCPICQGYEGQAWSYDDTASMPEIPDDTHPNCRCMVQLSEAEFVS